MKRKFITNLPSQASTYAGILYADKMQSQFNINACSSCLKDLLQKQTEGRNQPDQGNLT